MDMTEKTALLRKTIAQFFDVDEGQVGPTFPLSGQRGQGSIARAALDSAIRRRVGVRSQTIYSAKTYGELEGELLGHAATTVAGGPIATRPTHLAPPPAPELLRCGVDVELIENLPRAADYWEDAFYRDHFTPEEIAYCSMQEEPLQHFVARWCAKEALKKCDKNLMSEELKNLEVVLDESGAPCFLHHSGGTSPRLPHAVSLSHTSHVAIAVVVRSDGLPHEPVNAPEVFTVEVSGRPSMPPSTRLSLRGSLSVLLHLATLTLAAWALLRTFSP
jgi:phosphopantetheine--protein transferase-like protein